MQKVVRALIAILSLAVASALLVPPNLANGSSTTVNGIVIRGKIYDTWKATGGTTKLGVPVSSRVSATVSGRTARFQRFAKGQIFFSWLGKQVVLYPGSISLSRVVNERDALARYGFAPGTLLRTAKLSRASKVDRLKLATVLRNGVIIDLRLTSTAKNAPDPKLPKVSRVSIPINPDAIYPRYVTEISRRAAFARALRTAAAAKGTVLVHCTAGKDRTGWMVAMLMYAIGASDDQVMAEYLRTSGTEASKLQEGLDQAIATYGSIDSYLRNGLRLTDADFAALKAKFA